MNIHKILQHIRPNEEWSLSNNEYNRLEWLSKTPKPSLDEIKAAWPEVQNNLKIKADNEIIQKQIDALTKEYMGFMAAGENEKASQITTKIKSLKINLK